MDKIDEEVKSYFFTGAVYDYKCAFEKRGREFRQNLITPPKDTVEHNEKIGITHISLNPHDSIFDVCMTLRHSNNGSSDSISAKKAARYCGWLMMRLESWTYSSDKFDSIVRQLIEHTVEETMKNKFYSDTWKYEV